MSIRLLKNKEINRTKWDYCIKNAENRRIYALSWYLDSLTNNKWDALVLDDYRAVMPLPYEKKAGIKFFLQPWFCQQLGPFWIKFYPGNMLEDMRDNIPSPFYSLNLNSKTRFFPENSELPLKPNKVLSLKQDYDDIYAGIKSNHRRNLKKALKSNLEISNISIKEYMKLKKYSGARLPLAKWKQLERILNTLMQKEMLMPRAAYSGEEAIAAVCWIKDFNRLIYFQAAGNNEGRQKGAAFLLVNEILKDYSGTNYVLDFEGAVDVGVRRFYRGFGATNEAYPLLESKGMRYLKKLIGK